MQMTTYCPDCGAYLLILGEDNVECDQCGCEFEVTNAD